METIDIILKSLILIAFVICAIGLLKLGSIVSDYLTYIETENERKNRKVPIDGLWKKIFDIEVKDEATPKLLRLQFEAEKVKNKHLSDEIKTYQDLVQKLNEDRIFGCYVAKPTKDLEKEKKELQCQNEYLIGESKRLHKDLEWNNKLLEHERNVCKTLFDTLIELRRDKPK